MLIRFKTWYWGKFVQADALPTGPDAANWEVYDEAVHGWHHSEEAKRAAAVCRSCSNSGTDILGEPCRCRRVKK